MSDGLTHDELVALAALATAITRASGKVEPGEVSAFLGMFSSLTELHEATGHAGYRDAPRRGTPLDSKRWLAIYGEATERLDSDERIQRAARGIQRPEARVLMYGKLWELASIGSVGQPEQWILDWLRKIWSV